MAKWLHKRGLKMGIYLIPGLSRSLYQANDPILGTHYTTRQIVYKSSQHGSTLAKKSYLLNFRSPGTMPYLQSCANLYASWGVDYIKLDYVGPSGGNWWPYRGVDTRSEVAHLALGAKPLPPTDLAGTFQHTQLEICLLLGQIRQWLAHQRRY